MPFLSLLSGMPKSSATPLGASGGQGAPVPASTAQEPLLIAGPGGISFGKQMGSCVGEGVVGTGGMREEGDSGMSFSPAPGTQRQLLLPGHWAPFRDRTASSSALPLRVAQVGPISPSLSPALTQCSPSAELWAMVFPSGLGVSSLLSLCDENPASTEARDVGARHYNPATVDSGQWRQPTYPPFSPGPSSPDSALRPRRAPQVLDEKELMAHLRQVRRGLCVGAAWAQHGASRSLAFLGTLFAHLGASAKDRRSRRSALLTLTPLLCLPGPRVPAAAAPS